MNQSPSNSSMPRSTAEALKQIQKQGLSISIISGDNSKSFPLDTASKETRDKQNTVAVEGLVSTPRIAISSESKQTVSQSRHASNTSAETRASNAQPVSTVNQTVQPGSNKSIPPVSVNSEMKVQNSPRINNPNPLESKNQFLISNRITQTDKQQSIIGRLSQNSAFSEKKTHLRNCQNVSNLVDTKTHNRNNQAELKSQVIHTRTSNQSLTPDIKVNSNQSRLSVSSPPLEGKTLNNQGRSSLNCFTPVLDKNIGGQRSQVQISEIKTTNSQCKIIPIRPIDNRNAVGSSKGYQNVKLVPSTRPISQFFPNTSVPSSVNNIKPVDKSATNPFRLASTLTKSNPEEKSVKVTRIAPNVVGSENQSAQPKISQQISMKAENKAITPGIKISELSSELHQRPLLSENSPEALPIRVNTMPIQKAGVKRVALTTSTPIGKRKCVKLVSPTISEQSSSPPDMNASSSDESPVKGKKVFNLKKLTPGLTITPVRAATSAPSTSGTTKKIGESNTNQNSLVICPFCKQCSFNLNSCDSCHEKFTTTPVRYQFKSAPADSASIVVTENVTTSIEKSMQIVYHLPTGTGQNQSFQFQQSQQVIKVSPKKGRPRRRKFEEPVCYTLSSDDDEEDTPFDSLHEEGSSSHLLFPMEFEGNKSEQSSTSDIMQDENPEFDEYPGVTSIGSRVQINNYEEEEEEDEDLEQEMESEEELMDEEEHPEFDEEEDLEEEEEDEEVPPDEEERSMMHSKIPLTLTCINLKCRSIRIGSYKIHPEQHTNCIDVLLTEKGVSFIAPVITDSKKCVRLTLKASETAQMWVHFGKCLPIIFAYTSRNFGEAVKKALDMSKANVLLFDPTSDDVKRNKLTFLIDGLNDEQRHFMRQIFPGQEKLKEIDQKEANEILVKSTPQNHFIKVASVDTNAATVSALPTVSLTGVIPTNLAAQQSLSITKVLVKPAPVPVTKILTYPPPPLTGGVAINTADLATLEEGEFLNDAILDFYLKYVFYEKLSNHDREKTHIFSSFFYPRLTQKPDRQRPGDDVPKTMQVRRHNQVKTWTKHVDIFSKDYIIIPVNQHNHWFLAFICYPGHVVDAPVVKTEPKTEHSVSSTDDQDTSKVIIKEENNDEDVQNQDENSTNSNSLYEVEEPPDSDEDDDASSEIPDSSTHPDGSVTFHESNYQRKETPCILIFDSLSGPNRWRIASTLREYLEMEWKIRKGTKKVFDRNTMQGFIVKCPQQTNFSDCGLYVLQYVESFFENPIPYFANPMPDLTNWFSDGKISKKRQQLKELILNLQKKYQIKQVGISIKKTNQSSVSSPIITAPQSDNR